MNNGTVIHIRKGREHPINGKNAERLLRDRKHTHYFFCLQHSDSESLNLIEGIERDYFQKTHGSLFDVLMLPNLKLIIFMFPRTNVPSSDSRLQVLLATHPQEREPWQKIHSSLKDALS